MKIKIGPKFVGDGNPCFVIAEAGSNHNRDLKKALKLIDVAVEAGADAVKFQVFRAETLYSKNTPRFPGENKPPFELIRNVELPRNWLPKLAEHAISQDIIFLSTPFDYTAVDELDSLGVCAFKWASSEITDLQFLEYAASKGKPMIISTGMSNLADIQEAIDTIKKVGNANIILMQCTALYPTQPEQVNLRMMDSMRNAFHLPVGLSDHTIGLTAPIVAVARGACVIEKHFTLSRKLKGPDHPFSLEPEELKAMVRSIREAEACLGSPIKDAIPKEKEKQKLSRRSIIARADIPKGTRLEKDALIIKRPGYGIPPKFLGVVIGRKALRDIKKDEIVTWEMV